MQRLAKQFVPVADEVHRLQTGKGADCRLFREIAEQGHYAGRTRPTKTRQGIYLAAPSGVMLASCNTRSPETMARMLRAGIAKWEAMSATDRLGDEAPDLGDVRRWKRRFPENGLALRIDVRDLPDDREVSGWHEHARNRDFAWFTADEARSFIPGERVTGAKTTVPEKLARRLAACHLVDIVRGQTSPWEEGHVREAELFTEVVSRVEERVHIALSGRAAMEARGRWHVGGRAEKGPGKQVRGLTAELAGRATWDLEKRRFTEFTMVAIGERWGGTRYNARATDLGKAPIGFAFTLAGKDERIAPAFIWRYGW